MLTLHSSVRTPNTWTEHFRRRVVEFLDRDRHRFGGFPQHLFDGRPPPTPRREKQDRERRAAVRREERSQFLRLQKEHAPNRLTAEIDLDAIVDVALAVKQRGFQSDVMLPAWALQRAQAGRAEVFPDLFASCGRLVPVPEPR